MYTKKIMTTSPEENSPQGLLHEKNGNTRALIKHAVSYALVLVVGFVGGVLVMQPATPYANNVISHLPLIGSTLDATPDTSANLTDFWQVWNVLNKRFVETHASSSIPDTKKKLWGTIEGLTASYGDPYTVFMPPSDAKVFKQNIAGSFSGVGMEIGIKNNVLTVIAPLKGTPAARAGILSGDKIMSIDKHPTEGMSADEAVKLIRGPRGKVVVFNIMRNKKVLTIKVARGTIQVPEIDYGISKKTGVYHIALYTFTANSSELFDKAFKAFKRSGSKKLVIDLRGNPGGYLDAAVDIASHFLPKGDVVVTEDYAGKRSNIVHRSIGYDDVPKGTKIAVLIDQGSASAAEILSGALQDHHLATLIGTRSFGKGSVQELINIDGGSLKVTVARWLTPSGRSISDGGLTPEVKVGITRADIIARKDPQMARAVKFLSAGK